MNRSTSELPTGRYPARLADWWLVADQASVPISFDLFSADNRFLGRETAVVGTSPAGWESLWPSGAAALRAAWATVVQDPVGGLVVASPVGGSGVAVTVATGAPLKAGFALGAVPPGRFLEWNSPRPVSLSAANMGALASLSHACTPSAELAASGQAWLGLGRLGACVFAGGTANSTFAVYDGTSAADTRILTVPVLANSVCVVPPLGINIAVGCYVSISGSGARCQVSRMVGI
ncbi:MAG: hypothetical protein SNJ74_05195 [Fimbriimonadaceae bacterium]